jgi:hypothetical protein
VKFPGRATHAPFPAPGAKSMDVPEVATGNRVLGTPLTFRREGVLLGAANPEAFDHCRLRGPPATGSPSLTVL